MDFCFFSKGKKKYKLQKMRSRYLALIWAVLFAWARGGSWELLALVEASPSVPLVLTFSPDGRWLAVGEGAAVSVRDAWTLALAYTLGVVGNVTALAWSPSSTRLGVVHGDNALVLVVPGWAVVTMA